MVDNSSNEDIEAIRSDIIDVRNKYELINASVEERNRKLLEAFDHTYDEAANLCDEMENKLNYIPEVSIDSNVLNEEFEKYKVRFRINKLELFSYEECTLELLEFVF